MPYKIFVASSMRNSCRKSVVETVQRVNLRLEGYKIGFELTAYSEEPIADDKPNTQQALDHEVAESDMLILLADNNTIIGEYTFEEYRTARTQSSRSGNGRPNIKIFVLCDRDDEPGKIECMTEDGTVCNFENVLHDDSKRYVQFISRHRFDRFLEDWLMKIALCGFGNILTQKELSYGEHLHKIGQNKIRKYDNEYYPRPRLDGQIKNVLADSPIVILEGNTYSGKTRAAFEFMKNRKEWEEYDFHIYDNRHSIKYLNGIHRLDYTENSKGDVFLFDDINDIFNNACDTVLDFADESSTLWNRLCGYNRLKGFLPEDLGKTRIIFTVSGKLSSAQKNALYCRLFHITEDSEEFRNSLKRIIVDFDIYDKNSFGQMVKTMVRQGKLAKSSVRPGNYTIGSLFIQTENIRKKVEHQDDVDNDLMLVLSAHFKYAVKSAFTGSAKELLELYGFKRGGSIRKAENFRRDLYGGIERLRKEGLVVPEKEGDHLKKVFIDKSILDVIHDVVQKRAEYGNYKGSEALDKFLMDYAMECQTVRGRDIDLATCHICYAAQMGYLIIDRNELDEQETAALIEIAASVLIGKEARIVINPKDHTIEKKKLVENLVDIALLPGHYHEIFASAAIAKIRDFEFADSMLRGCLKYSRHCKDINREDKSRKAVELYKRAVYAMLSTDNRTMTMEEETRILNRIFDNEGNWIAPFDRTDLEDVFNLARLTAFMKKTSAEEIIRLLPDAGLDGLPENPDDADGDPADDEFNFDEPESSSASSDGIYEKVFLRQLDKAAIRALRRIRSLDEFRNATNLLLTVCRESRHVEDAVKRYFVWDFYKAVPEIAGNLNYDDRAGFFNFIYGIDDRKGVLGNIEMPDEYVARARSARIFALNQLLVYLDEHAALEGYGKMIGTGLCDLYTFSCLLKNEFLNFEQVLRLAGREDGQTHFITMNQLMGKAETLSDANVCMRLMGITDCNPCKLRDENALVAYLQIRAVDFRQCVGIIKGRRQLYPDELSDNAISAILNKFNIRQLVDVFFPSEQNSVPGYYQEHYGFLDEEITKMQMNAIHINKLFYRANMASDRPEVIRLLKDKFNEITENDKLRFLISDPQSNGNNGILSVYMKNGNVFHDYENVRHFYDNLPDSCKPDNVDHNIYSVFLWYIIDGYKKGIYSRTEAIKHLNGELIRAYKEFAKHYTRGAIVNMMPKLYRYRPLLTDESSFDKEEKYAYEDQELSMTFAGYLDHLIKDNPAFVDGTFIFNALTMMRNGIDDIVYEKLAVLASLNHTGVKYDTVFKSRGEGNSPVLSENVRRKLFRIGAGGVLDIDSRLVYNVSYIKVLWFLLSNRLITLENAEKYRRENNIPVTETYLNMVFKNIELAARKDWVQSGNDNEFLRKGFDLMVDKMEEVFSAGNAYVHKSIQMCLSLIAVAPDEESLNMIFTGYGFGEFEDRTEILAARMTNLLRLRHNSDLAFDTIEDFREMILANCRNVNIRIINVYLSTFVKIDKHELRQDGRKIDKTPFGNCWPLLEKEGKIDVFGLLAPDETTKAEISAMMDLPDNKWIMDANVQTFSYFARNSPNLLSIMDRRFNGNFTYDDSGRKSCLKDALKNYAVAYGPHKAKNRECALRELESISEILTRKDNRSILEGIIDEYIIKSDVGSKTAGKWKEMNLLWKDLLSCHGFRHALVRHICAMVKKMLDGKPGRYCRLASLEIADTCRIETLRNAFRLDKPDDESGRQIRICYNKLMQAASEHSGNEAIRKSAKLIKLLFTL